jgi:hypothetical protein
MTRTSRNVLENPLINSQRAFQTGLRKPLCQLQGILQTLRGVLPGILPRSCVDVWVVVVHHLPMHRSLVADVALLYHLTEMRTAFRIRSIHPQKRYRHTF